jgi:hypothetical protein
VARAVAPLVVVAACGGGADPLPAGTVIVEVTAAAPDVAPLRAPGVVHVGPASSPWTPPQGPVRFDGLGTGPHDAWLDGPYYAERALVTIASRGDRVAMRALPMLTHMSPPDPAAPDPAFDRVSVHVVMRTSSTLHFEQRVGGALARREEVGLPEPPRPGAPPPLALLEAPLPVVVPRSADLVPCVVHASLGAPVEVVAAIVRVLHQTGRCRAGATPEPMAEWIEGDESVRKILALGLDVDAPSTPVMLDDALAACAPANDRGVPGERMDRDLDVLARPRRIGACSADVHASVLVRRGLLAAAREDAAAAARWMRRALARKPELVLPEDASEAAKQALTAAPRLGQGLGGGGAAPKPARPTVVVGDPDVMGPHDAAALKSALEARAQELVGCYDEGRVNNGALAGTLQLRFVVGIDGRVATAQLVGGDLPDTDVASCAMAVTTTARMASAAAVSRVEVRLTFAAGR